MTAWIVPLRNFHSCQIVQVSPNPVLTVMHRSMTLGKLAVVAAASSESHDTAHPRPTTGLTTFLHSANLERVQKPEILEKSEIDVNYLADHAAISKS